MSFYLNIYNNQIEVLKSRARNIPENFKVESRDRPRTGKPNKRKITKFSKTSRVSQIKWLSKLRVRYLSEPIFVTLTYHEDSPPTGIEAKEDLNQFLVRLREYRGDLIYLWRMEYQKRGAIHFHLLIWSWNQDEKLYQTPLRTKIIQWWLGIKSCTCRDCIQYAVKIKEMWGYRGTSCYLNKYTAKTSDGCPDDWPGRFWGTSRTVPQGPFHRILLSYGEAARVKKIVQKWLREISKRAANYAEQLDVYDTYFALMTESEIREYFWDELETQIPNLYERMVNCE